MESFDNNEAYQLTDGLLRSIKYGPEVNLKLTGITPDIHEEITEELKRSGESVSDFRLPPFDLAFIPDSTGKIPFDVYKTDADPCIFKISCQLWAHNESSELTLTADYSEKQSTSALIFRLLETQ